jgi:integrase
VATVEPRQRRRADGTLGPVHYRVRWRDPDGRERSESFTRARAAQAKANTVEADKLRGTYVDPHAGKITLRAYAEDWLAAQTVDPGTHEAMTSRLRGHVYPVLGGRQLRAIRPSTIQAWLKTLDPLAPSYRRVIYTHVSSIMSAAVDDGILTKNPCAAKSVTRPRVQPRKVTPWPLAWLTSVHDALPDRYRIITVLGAGLGLRQGEAFGLSPDDIDLEAGVVHVRRQVKLVGGRQIFGLPKYEKLRDVPLPGSVRDMLAAHLEAWPARPVTLPWVALDGAPVTVPLLMTSRESKAPNRNGFNNNIWKPALRQVGISTTRENGCHALRHLYASVLLDAGESIKAVSEYLGHADPGFTLRTYTHLMPNSAERTRLAIDGVLGPGRGPSVAHEPEGGGSEQVRRSAA